MSERPRLLHRHSQHGYTSRPSEALQGEPEAVSADEQAQITRDAQRTAQARERAVIDEALTVIRPQLDLLDQLTDRAVTSSARVLRRQLDQLARLLKAGGR